MKKAFTFDDVALVPQFNNVTSRTEPDLSTWITKDIKIGMPLIAANMDTVICDALADVLLANGGFPIFHRFTDIEQQRLWAKKYCTDYKGAISTGLIKKDNYIEDLIEGCGAKVLCFDIAHGHSKKMLEDIDWIKRTWPHVQVIAGNVCTPIAYQDLVNAGADAVKVGIGPGAACTTRMVTGFGVPQFTAIRDCAEIAEKLRVPLIADGGIRNSRDVVLALAAGASTVMIGKLFALTEESAAEKADFCEHPVDGMSLVVRKAKYRGQASADFQEDYYGKLKDGTVPEGESYWAPSTGPAQKTIDELLGGLRSGLTYGGARSIKELQRKAEFVEVTHTYMAESKPRK